MRPSALLLVPSRVATRGLLTTYSLMKAIVMRPNPPTALRVGPNSQTMDLVSSDTRP